MKLTMTVNGVERTCDVHPLARLLDVLRRDFQLPGTKEGCGEGAGEEGRRQDRREEGSGQARSQVTALNEIRRGACPRGVFRYSGPDR